MNKIQACQHVGINWIKAGYFYTGCLVCGEMKAIKIIASFNGGRSLKLRNGEIIDRPFEPMGNFYPFPQAMISAVKIEWPKQKSDALLSKIKKKGA